MASVNGCVAARVRYGEGVKERWPTQRAPMELLRLPPWHTRMERNGTQLSFMGSWKRGGFGVPLRKASSALRAASLTLSSTAIAIRLRGTKYEGERAKPAAHTPREAKSKLRVSLYRTTFGWRRAARKVDLVS